MASAVDVLEGQQIPACGLLVPLKPRRDRMHVRVDHRLAALPNHPGMIGAEALDEYPARAGIQDHGELRVQPRADGADGMHPTRACLDREAHRRLEFIPVGVAHASPSTGPQTQPGEAEPAAILATPEVSTGYRRSRCTSTLHARGKHPGRGRTPAGLPLPPACRRAGPILTMTAVMTLPPSVLAVVLQWCLRLLVKLRRRRHTVHMPDRAQPEHPPDRSISLSAMAPIRVRPSTPSSTRLICSSRPTLQILA